MTGYVRVDTGNNIADGNVISAADLDNEFDGVQAAFNASTGHTHDGSAGEGAPITKIGPTQDVTASSSLLAPKTTNTVDVGSSSLKFKDLYLAGNASIGGTLAVTGVATFTAQPVLSSLTANQAVFTNGTKGLVSNAITGTGNVVMSTSPTLVTPDLGTPSSAILTNATGLPVATGISGLAAGVAAFLATPSSSNLATVVTDETGTGALVFANSPTLVSPALGTPSSGTVTNLTGTASININGTVGATTPNTGAFTTLSASGAVTLSGGTANGVAYLNGSKVLTSGSALTFDGTNFATTGSVTSAGSSNSGNLAFTGTGNRITGDFSNATLASRVMFQTSTTNGASVVGVLPNGTGTITQFAAYGGSDPANAQVTRIDTRGGTESRIESTYAGTPTSGTYLPMTFYTGGSERMRVDTSGNVGIGTSSPSYALHVQGASKSIFLNDNSTGLNLRLFNGTSSAGISGLTYVNQFISGSANALEMFTSGSSPLVFGTNSTERARIDSSGNLTVGSTTATSRANVWGANIATGAGVTASHGQLSVWSTTTYGANIGGTLALGGDGGTYQNITYATVSGRKENGSINNYDGYLAFAVSKDTSNTVVERARIDSSGNLLVGATSLVNANYAMEIRRDSGSAGIALHTAGSGGRIGYLTNNRSGTFDIGASTSNGGLLSFSTSASGTDTLTERARIDSSGNFGIGTSSPGTKLQVNSTTTTVSNNVAWDTTGATLTAAFTGTSATDAGASIAFNDQGTTGLAAIKGAREATAGNGYLSFLTRNGSGGQYATERARITSGGDLLVGTTSAPVAGYNCFSKSGADVQLILQRTGGSDGYGGIGGSGVNAFMVYGSSGGLTKRFEVSQAGSCFNTTGTYGTLSDIKVKENIQDSRGYLEDLCRVRVVKYSLKADQRETADKLGVVAQELEQIFPNMIDEQPDVVDGKEVLESTTKRVKYSVFVPMLIKAIQEQQAIITALTARVTALETN